MSEQAIDLNVTAGTFLEETREKNLCKLGVGKYMLDRKQKE